MRGLWGRPYQKPYIEQQLPFFQFPHTALLFFAPHVPSFVSGPLTALVRPGGVLTAAITGSEEPALVSRRSGALNSF